MAASPARWDYLDTITPQLPVSWYIDERVFAAESRVLFDGGLRYVGHELMVPERGSYHTIPWMDGGWMLVRNDRGVDLVSNVCRHRQALMLDGRGTTRNIVCPVHRWSYNLHGEQVAAPHFDANPCRNLPVQRLQNWQGLLFAGGRDVAAELADFGLAHEFHFSGYSYQTTWVEDYPINWKTFIEIYMELYHVEAFHPGLKGFVDAREFEPDDWQFGDTWSNQVMTLHAAPERSNSEAYRRYWAAVLDFRGRPPKYGTLWFCQYPNLMLEWYPEALAVSHLIPRSPTTTTNVVEFYYPDDVLAERPEIVELHQAAYVESAEEDGQILVRLDRGRRALHASGIEDAGPYQIPLETGMVHFHDWLRAGLAGEV